MTIYLPDDLAAEVKVELGDTNVSAVCQAALRDELSRTRAREEITAGGFERVEVYLDDEDEDVAFQGREIGYAGYHDQRAYLTPRGAIAVYNGDQRRLYVHEDYAAFDAGDQDPELQAAVAGALGEHYVRDLDI